MSGRPRARRITSAVVVGAVVAALAAVVGTPPGPAAALSPGLGFTADDEPTWQTNGPVFALAASHGIVVAGGDFTRVRPPTGRPGQPQERVALALFDAATGAPSSCQFSLEHSQPGYQPFIRATTVGPDGIVYIGGDFTGIDGVEVARLAALDVATCSVTSFRVPAIDSIVRAIAVHDQTLYFGGDFTTVTGEPRKFFAAVDTGTGDLTDWRADTDDAGRAVAVSPDGSRVAIGGDFFHLAGAYSHSFAVVDGATGAAVKTYPPGFIDDRSVTKTIISDGERFYVGNEGAGGGVFDGRLAVDWDSLDQVWRDNCLGATQALVVDAGTLYSASHAHDCSDQAYQNGRRNYFMAQDAVSGRMIGWDPRTDDGTGEGIGPRALAIATTSASGRFLWAGGEFTTVNGRPQQGLTRFGTTDRGAPPVPQVSAAPLSPTAVQVRWQAVVDPDDSELTYRVYRDGRAAPVWTGRANSMWWRQPQVTFVDRSVSRSRAHTYRVAASDGTNTSARSRPVTVRARRTPTPYAALVRNAKPTLYWSMARGPGEAKRILDVGATTSSTRRTSGIAEGGPRADRATPVRGDRSGSLRMDGVDDYLWEDGYATPPRRYSIELFVRTTTRTGGQLVNWGNGRPRTDNAKRRPSAPRRVDRTIYLTDPGRLVFAVRTPAGPRVVVSRARVNDGRWHHLVATQGTGGMSLWIDGRRVGRNKVAANTSDLGVWHVGGDNLIGLPGAHRSTLYRGLVDEVAVYPYAMGPRVIARHARAARR